MRVHRHILLVIQRTEESLNGNHRSSDQQRTTRAEGKPDKRLRCCCGSLLARVVSAGVELTCRIIFPPHRPDLILFVDLLCQVVSRAEFFDLMKLRFDPIDGQAESIKDEREV